MRFVDVVILIVIIGIGVVALVQSASLGDAGKLLIVKQSVSAGSPQSVVQCGYKTSFGWYVVPGGLSPAMQKQYAYGLAATTHYSGGSRYPPMNVPRC